MVPLKALYGVSEQGASGGPVRARVHMYSTKFKVLVFWLTVSDLTADVLLRLAQEAGSATRLTSILRVLTQFRRDRGGVTTVNCGYGTTVPGACAI